MSPAATKDLETFEVLPFIKTKEQKFNFGANVSGLDLNDISGMSVFTKHDASQAYPEL